MSPSWKFSIQHSMMRSNRLSHTALSIPHTLVCTISYVISITPGMLCSGFISHHQSCTTFPVIHGCLCFMEGRLVFIIWEGFTFWGTFSLFLSALVLFKLDLLLLSPTILRGTSLFPTSSIVVPSVLILVLIPSMLAWFSFSSSISFSVLVPIPLWFSFPMLVLHVDSHITSASLPLVTFIAMNGST